MSARKSFWSVGFLRLCQALGAAAVPSLEVLLADYTSVIGPQRSLSFVLRTAVRAPWMLTFRAVVRESPGASKLVA